MFEKFKKKSNRIQEEWIFNLLPIKDQYNILDIGSGDAALWISNIDKIPEAVTINLLDRYEEKLRSIENSLRHDSRFHHICADFEEIELSQQYDLIYLGSTLPFIKERNNFYLKIISIYFYLFIVILI